MQKKLTTFLVAAFKTHAKTTKWTTPTLQKRPLYNCLQVLILPTADVIKTFKNKAQVWGGGAVAPPCPNAEPRLLRVVKANKYKQRSSAACSATIINFIRQQVATVTGRQIKLKSRKKSLRAFYFRTYKHAIIGLLLYPLFWSCRLHRAVINFITKRCKQKTQVKPMWPVDINGGFTRETSASGAIEVWQQQQQQQ